VPHAHGIQRGFGVDRVLAIDLRLIVLEFGISRTQDNLRVRDFVRFRSWGMIVSRRHESTTLNMSSSSVARQTPMGRSHKVGVTQSTISPTAVQLLPGERPLSLTRLCLSPRWILEGSLSWKESGNFPHASADREIVTGQQHLAVPSPSSAPPSPSCYIGVTFAES
jgi:hypothetical protein